MKTWKISPGLLSASSIKAAAHLSSAEAGLSLIVPMSHRTPFFFQGKNTAEVSHGENVLEDTKGRNLSPQQSGSDILTAHSHPHW